MTYGEPSRGNHTWTLDDEASRPLIRHAVELGITLFDTANVYSDGSSEEIVGRALAEYTSRGEIVIATKLHGRMRPGPNGAGLSRKAVMAEMHGWTRFVSMQDHYNLLNREEEREMLPLCADQGIGVLPWSPLARGRLTRDWDETTTRSQADEFGKTLYDTAAADRVIAERVATIAAERGVPRARVALAWVLRNPVVTAPIVGASKAGHLDDAAAAVELSLTDDEVARLEQPYTPHDIAGFG